VTLQVVRAPFAGATSELLDQVNHNNELLKDNQGFHVTSSPVAAATDLGERLAADRGEETPAVQFARGEVVRVRG